MSTLNPWRLIGHEKSELPILILRSSIHSDGYTVYLSDLEHIWTEELSKDAITERARELGCSIDPSGDKEQYRIFSKKLKDVFEQAAGTSLELKSLRSGTNITLLLTAPLPKPLPKLEWEIHLQRRDDGLVQSELTGRLLNRTHALQQQIVYLMSELRAKDHVLSRLIDRLEASGTPLAEIFPNVSNIGIGGRFKKPSRERLAQAVRGLAPFDEESWSSQVIDDTAGMKDVLSQVLPQLAAGSELSKGHKSSWWRGLEVKIVTSPPDKEDASSKLEHNTLQDLPAPPDDSSTDDGQSKPPTPAKLEGNKKTERDIRTVASPPSSPWRLGTNGDSTSNADSLPRPPQTPVKVRPKLGVIGGKKGPSVEAATVQRGIPSVDTATVQHGNQSIEAATVQHGNSSIEAAIVQHSNQSSISPGVTQGRTKKLGAIGGKKTVNTVKEEPLNPTPSGEAVETNECKSAAALASSEEPEIPLEEKPDYRRSLLKRQQEQAKTTAKKKRKF